MEFKTLRYEKDKAQRQIVYVTLNRPEKSNAISIGRGNMTQEIKDAIVTGKFARRHTYDQMGGALILDSAVVYHTLGTNIRI